MRKGAPFGAPLLVRCTIALGLGIAALGCVLLLELLLQLLTALGTGLSTLLSLGGKFLLCAKQLDVGHLAGIAAARAGANDAAVAAVAVGVARSNGAEEAIDGLRRQEIRERLTAGVNATVLAERNHALHERAGGLGLGHGGVNAVIDDDGGDEVAKQGAAMAGVATQLESAFTVAHGDLLRSGLSRGSDCKRFVGSHSSHDENCAMSGITELRSPKLEGLGLVDRLEVLVLVLFVVERAVAGGERRGGKNRGRSRNRVAIFIDLHAERKTHLSKDFLDLVEALAAEVLGLQHLGLGLLDQLADGRDVGVLQAVVAAHRKFELLNGTVQVLIANRGTIVQTLRTGLHLLLEVDEDVHVIFEQLGRETERVSRDDRAV